MLEKDLKASIMTQSSPVIISTRNVTENIFEEFPPLSTMEKVLDSDS